MDYHNFIPLSGTESFNKLVEEGEIDLEKIDWDKIVTLDIHFSPKGVTQQKIKSIIKISFLRLYLRPHGF